MSKHIHHVPCIESKHPVCEVCDRNVFYTVQGKFNRRARVNLGIYRVTHQEKETLSPYVFRLECSCRNCQPSSPKPCYAEQASISSDPRTSPCHWQGTKRISIIVVRIKQTQKQNKKDSKRVEAFPSRVRAVRQSRSRLGITAQRYRIAVSQKRSVRRTSHAKKDRRVSCDALDDVELHQQGQSSCRSCGVKGKNYLANILSSARALVVNAEKGSADQTTGGGPHKGDSDVQ